uniref:Glycosyl transferase, group 1 n=1 Tax=Dechloromonas aromatica (strain RCB) TaxID=159087 RepID=Q47GK3_DECAR
MGLRVCQLCAVDFTLKHFLLPLIDGMQNHGWEVTAVCSDGPEIPGLRARGYTVDTIPISRSLNVFRHAVSVVRLAAYFRQQRFDILHVHTPVAALVARMAAFLARVPVVVYTAHGFYFHDEMPSWKRRLFVSLERFAGRFTNLLFTQSAEDAETAVQEGISPAGDTLAIGNGVDAGRFDPSVIGAGGEMRRALGIPEEAFVIGIIARQVIEKGIMEFLEAAIAAAGKNQEIHILMVGERLASDHAGDVEAELERAGAALGKRLVATGARKDIPELLAAMDVFCLPSWREGMPRTIIEAMMMGKAVIATDIRGSREEVVPGETGLLVPTRSPEALAEAFLALAGDRQKVVSMGLKGRERALALYDEAQVVALQIRRIEQLLNKEHVTA